MNGKFVADAHVDPEAPAEVIVEQVHRDEKNQVAGHVVGEVVGKAGIMLVPDFVNDVRQQHPAVDFIG